jgi:F420H(2)-dependent quinone reductase
MAVHVSNLIPRKPPRFLNPVMTFLLRSPWRKGMSQHLLLLTFTGRKSGRSFTIPMGYARQGNTVKMFTYDGWWRNLRVHNNVLLYIQGKTYPGIAEVIHEDHELIAKELTAFLRRSHHAASAYGVTVDEVGEPDRERVNLLAQHFTFIRVQL